MSGRVIQEFAPEALAKAKELQVPGSLATRAALGITLYLHGHHEPRVKSMISGAMKFFELYERDLSASSAKPESGQQDHPQFYKASEIFQSPSMSTLKEANFAEILTELKKTLSLIGSKDEHLLENDRLARCRDLLSSLATPYIASAMNSMGEYKRSRKGSTW